MLPPLSPVAPAVAVAPPHFHATKVSSRCSMPRRVAIADAWAAAFDDAVLLAPALPPEPASCHLDQRHRRSPSLTMMRRPNPATSPCYRHRRTPY